MPFLRWRRVSTWSSTLFAGAPFEACRRRAWTCRAPGYWNWDVGRHVWLSGRWERERSGHQYQSGGWVRDGSGYRLRAGSWEPVAQARYDHIRVAPPKPRYERIPNARDGYVWQQGYWDWRRNRHQWVSGVWVAERPGYNYTQPNWVQRDGRWFFEQSSWTPRGRDRDQNGVPDRFEHGRDADRTVATGPVPNRDTDRDGDGVRNGRDTDRDGDGVRNRHDEYPDNPRRN
jgi:hypothetical protein